MSIFSYVTNLKLLFNPFHSSSKLCRNVLSLVPPSASTQVNVNITKRDVNSQMVLEYKNGQKLDLEVTDNLDYHSLMRQISKTPNELKLKESI
ncbi:hypothetical protein E3P92_00928 [Wallemia ichthyophaga]|uniref:Large ribosomal subunit protein mL53 n=2 Tax=Wallemia ichthyophaga TaxID=245174 RepID=A0A4T0I7A5_WALIC|nr:uncharacterized protein J056_003663 [Wallemia ichthyophaga EXF-994]TIA75094.1 hypothetical protein E3P91_00663 [Wallemia ichthyophaga]EOR01987.1 hypothetical protein J056_003663 [Wallemia ichthyophaga EXF-994]TIA83655.1 hypothetical protein E3P98_00655 [Wallemia ichthyophaga]TIA93682.1 hypothetical protein E3P97_00833 [Wallemia ichthyophaga]TIB02665.1 hypothetical protein E3P95_00881 [Wallemia ichthyophaga]